MTLIILPFSPTVTKIIICFKINVHTYFFNFFNSFFTQLKRAKEELGRQVASLFLFKRSERLQFGHSESSWLF